MPRPGLYPNGNPTPALEPPTTSPDPRKLTPTQLQELGHTKQPLLRIIRTNCIECQGGSEPEVRRCRLTHCPFWPYRMATNPFTNRTGNPAAFKHPH